MNYNSKSPFKKPTPVYIVFARTLLVSVFLFYAVIGSCQTTLLKNGFDVSLWSFETQFLALFMVCVALVVSIARACFHCLNHGDL